MGFQFFQFNSQPPLLSVMIFHIDCLLNIQLAQCRMAATDEYLLSWFSTVSYAKCQYHLLFAMMDLKMGNYGLKDSGIFELTIINSLYISIIKILSKPQT